jgi:hypothetical protein
MTAAVDRARASAYVEIEGFLPNCVLRLAGFSTQPDDSTRERATQESVAHQPEGSILRFLRERFPDCEITVSPATVLKMD